MASCIVGCCFGASGDIVQRYRVCDCQSSEPDAPRVRAVAAWPRPPAVPPLGGVARSLPPARLRLSKGGTVRIHNESGVIQEERTFPRGRDPKSSPG